MTSLSTIGLLAAMAMALAAQEPGKIPDAWTAKYDAAFQAMKAGAHARAEAILLEVVAEAEKLGAQDLRLATPLETLAGLHIVRKHFGEAEVLLRRAVAIRERSQGREHLDVAETLVSLATCLEVRGKDHDDQVRPILRRAIAIIEKARGKESPELGKALHTLGAWHMLHAEPDEAESIWMRLLAIRERALGPDDPKVADILDDLGDLHTARSESSAHERFEADFGEQPKEESIAEAHGKKAEECYKRALAIREKALKPDDPDIAETLYNLGQLAMLRQRPADGERYLERWLKLRETAKAPDGEKHAKVYLMLAEASMKRKDWADAERRLAKVQSIVERVDGPESDEVAETLSALAGVALEAGRFDDVERLLRQALEIEAAIFGPGDPDIVEVHTLMAGGYRAHADDLRSPVLWRRAKILSEQLWFNRKRRTLGGIIDSYVTVLRRTNRVLPAPTEEDLAHLKKVGAMIPQADVAFLTFDDSLSASNLDDQGLAHISRMYGIERLDLGHSRITDAGLVHLKNLVSLKDLRLNETDINGAGIPHLSGLENLEELNLMSTRVTDAGLAHLKGLRKLRRLHLAFTDVTDAGLRSLEELQSLRSLDLVGTKATEAAVDRLRRARPNLEIEYEPGQGFLRATVPPGAAIPTRPATGALAPPPQLPGTP